MFILILCCTRNYHKFIQIIHIYYLKDLWVRSPGTVELVLCLTSHKAAIKMLASAGFSCKSSTVRKDPPPLLPVFRSSSHGSFLLQSQQEKLTTGQLARQKLIECKIIMGMISHHFYHHLVVWSKPQILLTLTGESHKGVNTMRWES